MSPRKKEYNESIRQKTRKAITDAAFELFGREGYTKTSISGIAARAGVSKGLIYHYFKSKEEILEAIYESLMDLSKKLLRLEEGVSAREKMKLMIDGSFHFITEMTSMARILMSLIIQPEAVASMKKALDKGKEQQMKLASGIFRELGYDDPEMESYYFGAKMDGVMLGYLALQDEYPLENMKRKIIDEYVERK